MRLVQDGTIKPMGFFEKYPNNFNGTAVLSTFLVDPVFLL